MFLKTYLLLLQPCTRLQRTVALDKLFLQGRNLLVGRVQVRLKRANLFAIVIQVATHVHVRRFQLINLARHSPQRLAILGIVAL